MEPPCVCNTTLARMRGEKRLHPRMPPESKAIIDKRRRSSLCCEFWRSSYPLDGTTVLPARWISLAVSFPDAFNVCLQTVLFPIPLGSCEEILRDAALDGLSFLHFKCWSSHYKCDGIGSGIFRRWLGLEGVLMVEHHNEGKDTKDLAPSFTKWGYKM